MPQTPVSTLSGNDWSDIRAILAETARRQAEAELREERRDQEADQRAKEADQRVKEADQRAKEVDQRTEATKRESEAKMEALRVRVNQTTADVSRASATVEKLSHSFDDRWGQLVESLVEGDLLPMLHSRGITVSDTMRHVEGQGYEFDLIAINGEEMVVVEVKTTLRPQHLKRFLEKLEHIREWIQTFAQMRVYGAVAYLQQHSEAAVMAEKRGLFVIRAATGNSASIINTETFQPRVF